MHRAKGIGHVHAALPRQGRHLLGQLGVVLGLALLKAGVLEQHDLAALQGRGLGLGVGAHHVIRQDHVLAQQLGQAGGHRLHAQLGQGLLPLLLGDGGLVLALLQLFLLVGLEGGRRLAHVGAGDHRRALVQQVLDGGQGGPDALVVSDDAAAVLSHRNVEIAAQKNLFALDVDVFYRLLVVVHILLTPFLFVKVTILGVTWFGPSLLCRTDGENRAAAAPHR